MSLIAEGLVQAPLNLWAAFFMNNRLGRTFHHDGWAPNVDFTVLITLTNGHEGGVLTLYEQPYSNPTGCENHEQYRKEGILESRKIIFDGKQAYLNAVFMRNDIVHDVSPSDGNRVIFLMHWTKQSL